MPAPVDVRSTSIYG